MASITDLSDLVNRMTGGNSGTPENCFWFKQFTVANVTDSWAIGLMYSMWKYDGIPGAGANPTTVANPTNATAGAISVTNPGGGRQKWLIQAVAQGDAANVGGILLYDRLLHIGGLDGTVTTAQTVGGTLSRHTTGVGNMIAVEIYTAVGTTARTITASYTNQAGTASRTTSATLFGGTVGTAGNDAQLFILLPLQAGDTGVQSVQSVTISATTGTAGNFGVNIIHPYCFLGVGSAAGRDFTTGPGNMPEIETNACLALTVVALTSTEATTQGMLATVEA